MVRARRGVTEDNGYMNVVIYGQPGEGKTHLMGTIDAAEGMGRVLIASAEAGERSLANLPYGADIDVIDIHSYPELNNLYEFCRVHCFLRDKWVLEGKPDNDTKKKLIQLESNLFNAGIGQDHPDFIQVTEPRLYYSVGIDHLTEIQRLAMYMILNIDIANIKKIDVIDKTPIQQDWFKSSELIGKLMRSFKILDMHTVYNAWEIRDKDETTGAVTILPSLPGKLASVVPGLVNLVGRLTTKADKEGNIHRILMVQPMGNFSAKDQSSNLGNYLVNPDFQEIYDLWTGKKTREDYPKYKGKK